ncbi:unnamed protein product [Adineta steineri]|uniref:Uncharacterized protein n=2 Tax=Adineta steineri TaxID=433720 RepID=A0A815HR48_9BILA|nr:unnamed protein product [Adineta steineri]
MWFLLNILFELILYLIIDNITKFVLIHNDTDAPKLSALDRQVVIVAPDHQTSDKNNQSSIEHSRIKQKKCN